MSDKIVKNLNFGEDAKDAVFKGIKKLTKAVSSTLGASGKCVILEDGSGNPVITKDGVTVADSIVLLDPVENMGATLLKEAARKTVKEAGDGTTTATVLAHSILKEAYKLKSDYSSRDLKNGINSAVNNNDGWAELSFEGTKIIIDWYSKEQLTPDYFYIVPRTTNLIQGTTKDDILIGTDSNDRIEGNTNYQLRHAFGQDQDILQGGLGDDLLIGGKADSACCGYVIDWFRFKENFGNDTILMFFASDITKAATSGSGYVYDDDDE